MVAILLGVLLMGQQPAGYYRQVIKNPTGKNGYEELVYAGDLLLANRFLTYDYLTRNPPTNEPVATKGDSAAQVSPETQAIWRELQGKNLLQQYRVMVAKNKQVIDLLEAAARKPIFDPRTEVDFNTLLPELAQFKTIARYLIVDTYVKFADGQNNQASSVHSTALDVFDRVGRGVLIQYLVGVACQSIVLTSIQAHLPQMSYRDAIRLEQISDLLLAREPTVREAMAREMKFMTNGVAKTFTDRKDFEAMLGWAEPEERERAMRTFNALGPAERQRVANGVTARVDAESKKVTEAFAGDEAAWVAFQPEPDARPDWSNPNGLIDAIVTSTLPAYRQVGRSAAINRTQIRLLGLVGSVLRYRWEHNALPAKLEQAVGKERVIDPLSKLPFELTRDASGNFAITSKGTKETGEVALRYRRAESAAPQGPP